MRTTTFSFIRKIAFAAIVFLLGTFSRIQAQYIPIDSAFADLLSASGMGGCIQNYKLDTLCAAADSNTYLLLQPSGTYPRSYNTVTMNGLQYFSHLGQNGDLKTLSVHNLPALQSLPAQLPDVFQNFELKYCSQFTTLPQFGNALKVLICEQTALSALPSLPANLQTLTIERSPINQLPALPATLQTLLLDQDFFTTIPSLPAGLVTFSANSNSINSMPVLPGALRTLGLNNNQLTALPQLPLNLTSIDVGNNYITQLPKLPQSLKSLGIGNNPIACLPILPDSLTDVFTALSNVTCLPNIPATLTNVQLPLCEDGGNCPYGGASGQMFWDRNNNCVFDGTDLPMAFRLVSTDNGNRFTMTDKDGFYRLALDSGNHILLPVIDTILFEPACTPSYNLFYNGWDTVQHLDFPIQTKLLCANLSVNIASSFQRLCSGGNSYYIRYQNYGTDSAYNGYVDVQIPDELVLLSSSPLWNAVLPGNFYRYQLGDVPPFSSGTIILLDSASCNAQLNQAVCVQANIYPHGGCAPVSALWDSSDIQVQRRFSPAVDSIFFTIRNAGKHMNGPVEYRVYEDELLQGVSHTQLASGDSLVVRVHANGHTFRVEADQQTYHPGYSKPRQFKELAGAPPVITGFVASVPQDDDDQWVDIDCHLLRYSFDPNEKEVFPSGIGAQHWVTANDQLTYNIRFQNTGTDTAFKVVIVDTLDSRYLDVSGFEAGPASHPYEVKLAGKGILRFTFRNIQLPDSNTNEKRSHGFVQFTIPQKRGNTPGTRINNVADIYFDGNSAVRTGESFVTIESKNVIFPLSVKDVQSADGYWISAYPNPFREVLNFDVHAEHGNSETYQFVLTDIAGRKIEERTVGCQFRVNCSEITTGVYVYHLKHNGREVGSGKIVAE
ncbi:MAG: T9SS type A sorting domain-containing protein [Chitinophagales bacterium]